MTLLPDDVLQVAIKQIMALCDSQEAIRRIKDEFPKLR